MTKSYITELLVAAVIPSYKVRDHILDVIGKIGPEVSRIYVVDDCCPDGTGDFVEGHCPDNRIKIIRHQTNKGVGGAVMTGYQAAIDDGMDIIIKIDGDGQMDPGLIPDFLVPIARGDADYTKGNRFFDLEALRAMPKIRLFGNAVLSFMTKISSGYWNLFDPTNGFTAIHGDVAKRLPFNKISERYFFETDMLFRLNIIRAVVLDVPMNAKYGKEVSNLKISKILMEFALKHIRNFSKRVFYNYYLRDMSIASLELPLGLGMMIFGTLFGAYHWAYAVASSTPSPSGTVMLSALPIIVGLQLFLAFLAYDISTVPTRPLHRSKSFNVF